MLERTVTHNDTLYNYGYPPDIQYYNTSTSFTPIKSPLSQNIMVSPSKVSLPYIYEPDQTTVLNNMSTQTSPFRQVRFDAGTCFDIKPCLKSGSSECKYLGCTPRGSQKLSNNDISQVYVCNDPMCKQSSHHRAVPKRICKMCRSEQCKKVLLNSRFSSWCM